MITGLAEGFTQPREASSEVLLGSASQTMAALASRLGLSRPHWPLHHLTSHKQSTFPLGKYYRECGPAAPDVSPLLIVPEQWRQQLKLGQGSPEHKADTAWLIIYVEFPLLRTGILIQSETRNKTCKPSMQRCTHTHTVSWPCQHPPAGGASGERGWRVRAKRQALARTREPCTAE